MHFSPHLVYVRNWGEGASFALTRKFLVSVDSVNTGPDPEIEAVRAGQATADEYYLGLVEGAGWSKEAPEDRPRKTALLLEQDPADLFCEVTIHSTGALLIHDGFHRAPIMASSALGGVYVKVTINLFFTQCQSSRVSAVKRLGSPGWSNPQLIPITNSIAEEIASNPSNLLTRSAQAA